MMDNNKKIILDLCGGTGAWSLPYKKHGYCVINITLPNFDITLTGIENDRLIFRSPNGNGRAISPPLVVATEDIYGILSAPPCTMFSFARTKANKDRNLREGMECVRACLNIIWACMEVKQNTAKKTLPLKFWALENPNGMLKFFLGKPAFEFNPYDFGDQYQKQTHLWGWFNEPKKNPIELTAKQKELHKTNSQPLPVLKPYKSLNIAPEMFGKLTNQERRAITPAGFAKAFFDSNR